MRTGDCHLRYRRGFHLDLMCWVVALSSSNLPGDRSAKRGPESSGRSSGLLVGVPIEGSGIAGVVGVLRCVFATLSPPASWDGSGVDSSSRSGMAIEAERVPFPRRLSPPTATAVLSTVLGSDAWCWWVISLLC
jgi:hypothetical protein